MRPITVIALTAAFLASGASFGKDAPKANPFNEVLAAAPAAELPAKAADLVVHAQSRDQPDTTVNVVQGAVGMKPAAAPAIVGAVARAVPDMAAVAAGAAAVKQPRQAGAIAKAAAAAAPTKAGKIVAAVCRAVPNDYRNIALAVAQVVPGAGKEIVSAVATALPGLRPAIERTLAGYGGNVVSVADTLDRAAKVSPSVASGVVPATIATPALPITPMARGPVSGPPYVPLTSTPITVTPGTSGEVPTGGRNYAAP